MRYVQQNEARREVTTYRNQSNTRIITEPIHLPLLLAIQQAILVLHANELRPSSVLSNELHARELCSPHAACADISHLTAANQVVESFHCLFDWCIGVETVDLKEVDVVNIETF